MTKSIDFYFLKDMRSREDQPLWPEWFFSSKQPLHFDLVDNETTLLDVEAPMKTWQGACFSKVPKLFGPISGATIAFIPSKRRGSKPSNFAILLFFLILKTCKKISFSKQADCSLTASFSGPKRSRDSRNRSQRPVAWGMLALIIV